MSESLNDQDLKKITEEKELEIEMGLTIVKTVRLNTDMDTAIKRLSGKSGITIATILRDAVVEYLKNHGDLKPEVKENKE